MDIDYELRPSSPDNMSMMELSDSDEPMICDRCNCNLGDEWWHCDICSYGDYDICQRCSEKKLRCKDDSHDLTEWKNNVDLGNGVTGPQPTGIKIPGNLNRWAVVEDTHPTANDGWGCVEDSMAGVWGDVDSSTNWGSVEPTTTSPNAEATSSSSDHPDLTVQVIDRHLTYSDTALRPATPTNWGAQTMADDTNTAAPTATGHHFTSIRAARAYLNASVARWAPPSAPSDASNIPATPSAEWAYVHAAVHSVTIGLKHTPRGEHMLWMAGAGETEPARLLEARAWLLFDALKRLHDDGCVLPPDMDFSNDFGGELGDRMLDFRARWVAVCKMLQKSSSAAEMVASGSTGEEILEAYVAAPLAMGRKMEKDERLASEGSGWTKPKLPPALKRLQPVEPPSSDEQEAREEKKRKLKSRSFEDDIEFLRDEERKAQKAQEDQEEQEAREALYDRMLKNYVW